MGWQADRFGYNQHQTIPIFCFELPIQASIPLEVVLNLMLLVPIGWAHRVWALPFLTVLAPSERYNTQPHRRHKKLTHWARQRVMQVRRWLPERDLIVVADSSFAALEFLTSVSQPTAAVDVIIRLRWMQDCTNRLLSGNRNK